MPQLCSVVMLAFYKFLKLHMIKINYVKAAKTFPKQHRWQSEILLHAIILLEPQYFR
jgi:hypothetical protein